jgi:hypothetical protein
MPGRNNRVLNISRGARVGVTVGVLVGVGVFVEVGVLVEVGEGVLLGLGVAVRVEEGTMVHVGVGLGGRGSLQAASHPAITNRHNNPFENFLWSDAKKRIMIVDFIMVDAEGVISIPHETLG